MSRIDLHDLLHKTVLDIVHLFFQKENHSGNETLKPRMRKRLRTIFTSQQVSLLEAAYNYSKYPDANMKRKLALKLDLPVDRVQVWFQNKRTRDQRANKPKTRIDKTIEDNSQGTIGNKVSSS